MNIQTKPRWQKLRKLSESSESKVCYICFDKTNPQTTSDYGCNLVSCHFCGITVHYRCCGLSSLSPISSVYTCPRCSDASMEGKICFICTKPDGYLTKTEDGRWLHPVCGILIDSVELKDFARMIFTVKKELMEQQEVWYCDFCGTNKGQRLQCAHPNCYRAAHIFCAYTYKAMNSKIGWQINLTIDKSSKATYSEPKKLTYNERSNRELEELRDNYKVKNIKLDETRQKNVILNSRGGRITIYCNAHFLLPTYCICNEANNMGGNGYQRPREWMIGCDYCDNWYHGDCIGVSQAKSKELKVYVCDRCKLWESAKSAYLLNESSNKFDYTQDDLIINETWIKPLYPATTSKLIDILLVSQVFTTRSDLLLNTQCNIELLYNQLVQCTEIPMMLENVQAKLKAKLNNVIRLDLKILDSENTLTPSSVLSEKDGDYNIITLAVQRNKQLKQILRQFERTYESDVKAYTKCTDKIKKLMKFLDILLGLERNYRTGVELEEAKEFLKILSEYKFTFIKEIEFIELKLSQYNLWESNLNKDLLFNKMQIDVDNIVIVKERKEIDSKIKEIESIMKHKIDKSDFERILEESSLNFIKNRSYSEILKKTYKKLIDISDQYKIIIVVGTTLEEFQQLMKEICEVNCFSPNHIDILKDYDTFIRNTFLVSELLTNGILIDVTSNTIVKEKATIEDANNMLEELYKAKVRPLCSINKLSDRLNDIKLWKTDLGCFMNKASVTTTLKTSTLRYYISQGEAYKIQLPELEDAKAYLSVLELIDSYKKTKSFITYDTLCKIMKNATSFNIPGDFMTSLNSLFTRTQSLLKESNQLLSTTNESYDKIEEIRGCIASIKNLRILIPTLSSLEQIVSAYEWQKKVLSFLNVSKLSHADYSIIENLPKEIVEKLCKESEAISTELIGPARTLQKKFQHVKWLQKVKTKMCSTLKFSEKEIKELINEIVEIRLDTKNPSYSKYITQLLDVYDRYKKVVLEYENLINIDIDLLNEQELKELLENIKTFEKNNGDLKVDLTDFVKQLNKTKLYINTYRLFTRLIKAKESSGINPTVYTEVLDNCVALSEEQPKSKLIESSKCTIEEYKLWMKQLNDYKEEKEKQIRTETFTVLSLKEFVKKGVSLELSSSDDIEMLKADIMQGEENEAIANNYLYRLMNGDYNISIEKLTNVIEKMKLLPLYSNEMFYKLKAYLWMFQAKNIMESSLPKKKLSVWNKLMNDRKEIIEAKMEKHMINTINIEDAYNNANLLFKQVEDIKSNELNIKLTKSVILTLIDQLKESKVDFGEEVVCLESLISEYESICKTFTELTEKRGDFSEFEAIEKQIGKLPLNFDNIRDELSNIINSGHKLLKLLGQFNLRGQKPNETSVTSICTQYSKLVCRISEAENLIEKYNRSKEVIKKLMEELESSKDITLDEIRKISNDIIELPIEMCFSAKPLILEICRKKCTLFMDSNDEYKPALGALKGLLEDFTAAGVKLAGKDFEKIQKLQSFIEEAELAIKKIREIDDVAELDKYEQILSQRPIDYTDQLIEQRVRIKLQQGIKAKLPKKRVKPENSINKNFVTMKEIAKDDSNEITAGIRLSTKKMLEMTISTNKEFKEGKKGIESLINDIEEEMKKQAKDKKTYKNLAEQVHTNLSKLHKYPLLSAYIGKGKLELWKLLKISDQTAFMKKLEKLEGIIVAKRRKRTNEDTSERRKLRQNLLADDDEIKEQLSSTIQSIFRPNLPSESNIQTEEDKSVEAYNIQNANFSDDDTPEEHHSVESSQLYQPTLPRMSVDKRSHIFNSQNKVVEISKIKTILIPYVRGNDDSESEEQIITAPVGSLIRVWSGRIEGDRIGFQCSMLTTDNIQDYCKEPALISKLKVDGRAKASDVIQYLSTNLTSTKIIILKGWVVPEENSESLSNLQKYSLELDQTDRCFIIDIKEFASHLYLIPWSAKTFSFMQYCGINPVNEDQTETYIPKLTYFFAYKKHNPIDNYKLMRPTIIRLFQHSESTTSTNPLFSGVPQAEAISDEEEKEKKDPKPEHCQVEDEVMVELKEKLSKLSSEEIQSLKDRLDESNRASFEKLIEDVFSKRNYQPIDSPIGGNSPVHEKDENDEYLHKVKTLQDFIIKNRVYFLYYTANQHTLQYSHIMRR